MTLNYKTFGEGFPLVILHGLLGSLDNWLSIAKQFSAHFSVYVVDLRNHGKSPHSSDFSYQILVDDLCDFFEQHSIHKAHVIGHSMGGKAAMEFAMLHPAKVEKLVVADVAPVQYEDRHSHIFKALLAINLHEAKSRETVEMQLRNNLNQEDESTIQFLMKGLYRNEENNFAWRFNVEALWQAYQNVADGVGGTPFWGKTLFLKGQKSNYINAENYAVIQELFPNNELEEIAGAGHWVHADAPKQFTEKVLQFLLQ
jgi:pimeloyl-ACP methyl ester carboxylesterase